jgi:bla regulator protein BlaR1
MTGILTHLLESTLFAAAVWLTTLSLRRNHARTRHALWMAASVKFLIPFSLLVALGSQTIRRAAAPAPPPQMRFMMVDASPDLHIASQPKTDRPAAIVHRDWLPQVMWVVWFGGCAGLLIRWRKRWHSAAVNLRESTPWKQPPVFPWMPAPVRSSPSIVEPSVFGVFRPVLVVPAGIEEHLSAEQLQAVFAHELCHIRHRDNLAAAVHMLVEAVFWFHPLVWWMSARLVDERERACDEEVVQLGHDRAVYAESILRVCRFCLESPVACVSGITGADLKQRIRSIMTGTVLHQLQPGKKLLLAAMGVAAVAGPLAVGLTQASKLSAQAAPQTAAPLQFDIASLKMAPNQDVLETKPKRSVGRFRWTTQLAYLLGYAYNLEWWRILGDIPGFGSIYEIEATTDPKATRDQVRLMLQSLLIERFKMTVHRVTKDADGYALTVAKGGPKMQEAKEGEVPALPDWMRGPSADPASMEELVAPTLQARGIGAITGRRVTMLQLTETLQRLLNTAVLDQTGLSGQYYFAFRYAAEDDPDVPYQSLFGAIKELGLKLEKHKGPVEMLVVDHIEKIPTEN